MRFIPSHRTHLSTRLTLAAALLALPMLAATGCATSKDFRRAVAQRKDAKQEAKQNEAVAYSARAEAQVYRAQLQAKDRDTRAKEQAIAEMTEDMVRLQSELDSTNAAYTEAVDRAENPLPPELAKELETFATTNGDLLEYDAKHGLIRFKSDVTFAPGSADLTPQAASAAKRLATILNTGNARNFELMVTGHTDNKPVSRTTTIKKGHKDNWYLSSHRAIAVSEAMRDAGISSSRMAVVGYADQRPATTNATAQGRASNRRVEVMIVPADSLFGRPDSNLVTTPGNEWTGETFNWMFNGTGSPDAPVANTSQAPIFQK